MTVELLAELGRRESVARRMAAAALRDAVATVNAEPRTEATIDALIEGCLLVADRLDLADELERDPFAETLREFVAGQARETFRVAS